MSSGGIRKLEIVSRMDCSITFDAFVFKSLFFSLESVRCSQSPVFSAGQHGESTVHKYCRMHSPFIFRRSATWIQCTWRSWCCVRGWCSFKCKWGFNISHTQFGLQPIYKKFNHSVCLNLCLYEVQSFCLFKSRTLALTDTKLWL
jgi:hypothetical protein